MTDIELLPCPFCGGRPYMHSDSDVDGCYWSKVRCSSCDVATRGKWASSSANTCPQWYAEVREEWNTRANVTHAADAKDAEIKALRAEVEKWKSLHATAYDAFRTGVATERRLEARAERLAEALRGIRDYDPVGGDAWLGAVELLQKKARAALRDHEEGGSDNG